MAHSFTCTVKINVTDGNNKTVNKNVHYDNETCTKNFSQKFYVIYNCIKTLFHSQYFEIMPFSECLWAAIL